jgi:O-antigen ligase
MRKAPVITFVVAGVALILALIPFHALITVWASTLVGHYTLLRLWKELLILPLGVAALWLVGSKRELYQHVLRSWLFRCMIAYFVLLILLGLIALGRHTVTKSALYEGLIVDLRLVTIFFIAWVAASYSPWLKDHWRQLLVVPAIIVVVFGLLQTFVLPADVLSHVGYTASTIKPFDTVDQNMQFVRVQSTLRGADPLGAYLVLVLAAITVIVAGLVGKRRALKERQIDTLLWASFGVASLIVLYFTYSRSAYVGAFLAMALAVWLAVPSVALRRWLLVAVVVVSVVFGGVAFALRHNPTFEDTFFHTSQLSKSPQSSNHNHQTALKSGLHDIIHHPFGLGPGSAGPASEHNRGPARISENYFLQIGQEAGMLGLGLFVAINVLIGKALWDQRAEQDQLALILFVSLIGLTFVNLLLHAWADDTLAYLWWGLAGIATAATITANKKSKNI